MCWCRVWPGVCLEATGLRRGVHLKHKLSPYWPCFLGDCVDIKLPWKLTCMKMHMFLWCAILGGFAGTAQLHPAFPSLVSRGGDGLLVRESCTSRVLTSASALALLWGVIWCKACSCAWPWFLSLVNNDNSTTGMLLPIIFYFLGCKVTQKTRNLCLLFIPCCTNGFPAQLCPSNSWSIKAKIKPDIGLLLWNSQTIITAMECPGNTLLPVKDLMELDDL